jgi:valyl-tRNA synthetase
MDIIRAIRNMRAEKKVTPGKKIAATIAAGEKLGFLVEQKKVLCALAYLDPNTSVIAGSLPSKPKDSISLVVAGVELHFPLAGIVDMDQEKTRVKKEIVETRSQIDRLEKLLASDFAKKAPLQLIEKERQKLETYKLTLKKLKSQH